jgi:hypothetical protein
MIAGARQTIATGVFLSIESSIERMTLQVPEMACSKAQQKTLMKLGGQ